MGLGRGSGVCGRGMGKRGRREVCMCGEEEGEGELGLFLGFKKVAILLVFPTFSIKDVF